jgi:hypothetical protein
MKLTTSIVCLLAVSVCLVAPTQAVTPVCSDTNPFWTWLKSLQADAVLSTANTTRPTAGWEVCDTTWGTDGTCCDLSKLKENFKKVAGQVMKGWKDFMDGFKKFKDNSSKIKQAAGGADIKTKVDSAKAAAPALDFNGMSGEQAQAVMNKIDTLDEQLKTFKSKADACFNASNAVRGSLFCSGCQSGTGFTFATNVLTYTFQTGTCNTALEACVPVWSLMFNLQAQMAIAVQVRNKEKGNTDKPKGPPALPKGKNFGQMATIFTNCPNGKVEGTCTQADLDLLCGMFISFKNAEPIAKPADDTDMSNAQPGTTTTPAAPAKRVLQTTTADDGTGTGAASGIKLNAETKMIPSGVAVDATTMGQDTAASHGNIIVLSLLALLAYLTSI